LVFYIKKSYIRLRLVVTIKYNIKGCNYSYESLPLYHDLFYLKKKNLIKDKLLNIVTTVKYNELFSSVKGDVAFMRKLKLEELKKKM